uniref:Death associated protein 1b n=1 Tax=Paramormyrops kingsleyae TaxID=1676925 RepID=A0A3B3RE97_9TELE
ARKYSGGELIIGWPCHSALHSCSKTVFILRRSIFQHRSISILSAERRTITSTKQHQQIGVKAGGKRVAKKSSEENGSAEKDSKRPAEKPRSLATSPGMQSVNILLVGTLEKLGHEFPTSPVSIRHSKVKPAVEKTHSPKVLHIHQPRKC